MLEFKILKNSKSDIMIIGCCMLCYILGFILLISLDGYAPREITISQLQYSIYTVYTQFGFFIFPILPMSLISTDYKEKNITFYKTLGYTPQKYLFNKFLSISSYITVCNLLLSILLSVIYMNFSTFLLFFMKLQNVSIFITMISLALSYLFVKFIKSFCISFALWIAGIVIFTMNPNIYFFAFYDATLQKHIDFQKVLKSNMLFDSSIIYEVLYNGIVFGIVILLTIVFKKRWSKNGV